MTSNNATRPKDEISQRTLTNFVTASDPAIVADPQPPSQIREYLSKRGSGKVADNAFAGLMLLCALSIFAIVIGIATILILRSNMTIVKFGWAFFKGQNWDPVSGDFGALPFIFGTLATSFLALLMAVPLALGVAIFLTELCVRQYRS